MIYFDNLEFNTELKYEVYILNKYLVKHYGVENAKILLDKNSSQLDLLAKALGKIDIEFFCLYFMSDTFVVKQNNFARQLSAGHYELWEIANNMLVKDFFDKACIIEPRGFAKTTIFDMAVSVWSHCYKKSIFTIIGAKTDTDATQFLDTIKDVFNKNKKILKVFGRLIDSRKAKNANGDRYTINNNEVEFTNETYIKTVGSGTSVRGANWMGVRPTLFIGDDFQDKKNILTEDSRNKQYNKWTTEIEQVGDKAVYRNGEKIKPATKIIAIGTVLHIDCLMSKLSRNNDYRTIIRRAILLKPNQTVENIFESELWLKCHGIYFDEKLEKDERKIKAREFYAAHTEEMKFPTLWDEKWDCFNDLAIPYWEDRQSFMSELMNDASSIGDKWFKSVATMLTEDIENHKFIKTALIVDPASSTSSKNDFTAAGVLSKASNEFTYVRDLFMKRLTFEQYCEKVVDLIEKHSDITHVVIEKNVYMGADINKIQELISKRKALRGRRLDFINTMQKKNKDEKISTVVDPMNNGQIILNSDCEDTKAAIEQIKDFQGQLYTLHDDFIDMIAEGENALKEIKALSKLKLLDRNLLF